MRCFIDALGILACFSVRLLADQQGFMPHKRYQVLKDFETGGGTTSSLGNLPRFAGMRVVALLHLYAGKAYLPAYASYG
jgi:hypothetical protein